MTGQSLAITGATGFVGRTLLDRALATGNRVQALARSPQPERLNVAWIKGALDDTDVLNRLVAGCDAVIHVAGVVNAPGRGGFETGNVHGTRAIVAAAEAAGVSCFVHVSSLSARKPLLSDYGWSKAEAEAVVQNSSIDWTIIRPPAIYGPGDRDHLDLFKAAKWGVIPLPPRGFVSEIEVGDLARLLLALAAAPDQRGKLYEADDGRDGGWSHVELASAIGAAVGRRVLPLPVPATVVRLGARIDRLLRGSGARLTPDRAAYFCHPDWVVDPAARPAPDLWHPQVETRAGLAATARWYREAGWL